MNTKEETPIVSATQILADHGIDIMKLNDDFNSQLLHAMERYAEQKFAPQSTRIEQLEKVVGNWLN